LYYLGDETPRPTHINSPLSFSCMDHMVTKGNIFAWQAVGEVYTSTGPTFWGALHSVPGDELQYRCSSRCWDSLALLWPAVCFLSGQSQYISRLIIVGCNGSRENIVGDWCSNINVHQYLLYHTHCEALSSQEGNANKWYKIDWGSRNFIWISWE
jgi:hypothetical protein